MQGHPADAGVVPEHPADDAPADDAPAHDPAADDPPADAGVISRLRGGRWDPGRRGVAALALLAVVSAGVAAAVVLRGRPQELAAPAGSHPGTPFALATHRPSAPPGGGPGGGPHPSGPTLGAGEVVVAVAGRVRRPGLVHLPAGSRVDDALRAAGGVAPDASAGLLNLARRLVDGEQVLVGVPSAPADPGSPSTSAGAAAPVDLNAATLAQLDALPGVGPVLAQRILTWRSAHGRFASVEQLREVPGIGEATFTRIRAGLTV